MKTSLTRALLNSEQLLPALSPPLADGRSVPLLVVRLPEFSEAAWRSGKRTARRLERTTSDAFRRTARNVVREEDLLVHDTGSDWFAIAMLAPARDGAMDITVDARAALERIAAGVSLATGRRVETGWHPLAEIAEAMDLPATIAVALERGARERERYEFLATVGHELRTPLTSIRGYIETLLDGDVDAETTRRFLHTARNESLRLGRLVDGMLDFSMLDLSARTTLRRSSDIAHTIAAAVEALGPIATERAIAMEADLPGVMPARIDADACMHAVINLIENALKYGRAGGRVRVAAERRDPFIRIIVDDDGAGIAAAERDVIFGLHMRGRATAGPGRGIGLAIVRTIAERVGGAVWAEESPLGGARFVLQILRAEEPFSAESVPLSS